MMVRRFFRVMLQTPGLKVLQMRRLLILLTILIRLFPWLLVSSLRPLLQQMVLCCRVQILRRLPWLLLLRLVQFRICLPFSARRLAPAFCRIIIQNYHTALLLPSVVNLVLLPVLLATVAVPLLTLTSHLQNRRVNCLAFRHCLNFYSKGTKICFCPFFVVPLCQVFIIYKFLLDMNVVQNYLLQYMKGDLSLLDVRIFMRIVEHANQMLSGQRVSKLIGKAVCTDEINCNFTLMVSDVVPEGSHHHGDVRKALLSLMSKQVTFFDGMAKKWYACTLVNNVVWEPGKGVIRFTVPRWLLGYILNFISGNFTMYNLSVALTLPSAYAVRWYWFVCSMTAPVKVNIQTLRGMLGVPDGKYNTTKDFIKRCVEDPKSVLDRAKVNSFTYVKCSDGVGKRITGLFVHPKKNETAGHDSVTAQAPLSAWGHPVLRSYLIAGPGFTRDELARNKDLLFRFSKINSWESKITEICERARRLGKGKGYILNAMKSEVRINHL